MSCPPKGDQERGILPQNHLNIYIYIYIYIFKSFKSAVFSGSPFLDPPLRDGERILACLAKHGQDEGNENGFGGPER